MTNSFPLDLKMARRASGLTQSDCAHLLDSHRSKVSHLECGKTQPKLRDLCLLSLIHDSSFESLFDSLMEEMRDAVRERVQAMPPAPEGWRGSINRKKTLDRLKVDLEDLNTLDYDTA